MNAWLYLRHAPALIENNETARKTLAEVRKRLKDIQNAQNIGIVDGKLNGAFMDPEKPDDFTKVKLLDDSIYSLTINLLA